MTDNDLPPNVKITRRKVTDYKPAERNANAGTERGRKMIEQSVEEDGIGRGIVAVDDDTIIAGSHALQEIADAGFEEVIEVETDGKTLVVTKRRDWSDEDQPEAQRYALRDNRTTELNLSWEAGEMVRLIESGEAEEAGLGEMFFDNEVAEIVEGAMQPDEEDWLAAFERETVGLEHKTMTFTLTPDEAERVGRVFAMFNGNNTRRLLGLCESWETLSSDQ